MQAPARPASRRCVCGGSLGDAVPAGHRGPCSDPASPGLRNRRSRVAAHAGARAQQRRIHRAGLSEPDRGGVSLRPGVSARGFLSVPLGRDAPPPRGLPRLVCGAPLVDDLGGRRPRPTRARVKRRRTIAIVANEFFAPELGRMGGFGWAAREASRAIREQLDAELDVVFVSCEHRDGDGWPAAVHGRPLVTVPGDPPAWRGRLAPLKIDAFLTIDFRPSYAPLLRALPTTPLLVWVRDPRSSRELSRLATLRVPGSDER